MTVNKDNFNINFFHNAYVVESTKSNKIKRRNHWYYVLNQQMIKGEVLEFGVYRGATLKLVSQKFLNQKVYGFDSFEGLPEDWFMTQVEKDSNQSNHPTGHFDVHNIVYDFSENVILIKGFFNQSLPNWLEINKIKEIKLLHIDSDLYSSAIEVLTLLNQHIVSGTIIVFDELYPWSDYSKYTLWEEGEWKALKEWVIKFDRSFEVISRNQHQQAAIRILK